MFSEVTFSLVSVIGFVNAHVAALTHVENVRFLRCCYQCYSWLVTDVCRLCVGILKWLFLASFWHTESGGDFRSGSPFMLVTASLSCDAQLLFIAKLAVDFYVV